MQQSHRRTVMWMSAIVLTMGGLSFAAVPLYDLFCRVTGYGGTTQRAERGADRVLDRTITVRFDANVARDMPWTFQPLQREMTLRIGETGLAFYRAHNPTNETVIGTATFNVLPHATGSYFNKIECFCFTEQVLKPGETVDMPVTFFVDPSIMDDKQARKAAMITLSYSMFRVTPKQGQASVTTPAKGG